MAGDPKKKGFIRKFLRKLGEPPVLMSTVKPEFNSKIIANYLQNIGYFHAVASGDTVVKKKKGHATYTLTAGPLYTIKNVNFNTDTSSLGKVIGDTKSNTLLKSGDAFNLDVIKAERIRVDGNLKEEGYYFFSPDDIIVDV